MMRKLRVLQTYTPAPSDKDADPALWSKRTFR